MIRRTRRIVMTMIVSGFMMALPVASQNKPVTATPIASPAFDVVSIHLVNPDDSRTQENYTTWNDASNRVSIGNNNALSLIMHAYGIREVDRVKGLPPWTNTANYVIEARMDDATAQQLQKLPIEDRRIQRQAMLQAFLADRFKLKTHFEDKEMPVYEMVVDKGGLKAKLSEVQHGKDSSSVTGRGKLDAKAVSLTALAGMLSHLAGQVVIDKTGISGDFDISLSWAPEGDSSADDPRPSLYTALQEQLGLKLKPAKSMVKVLIVDQIEKPSEN